MAQAQTPANPIPNQDQYRDANSNPSPDSRPPQSLSAPPEAAVAVAADNPDPSSISASAASTEASASAATLKRRREEGEAAEAEAGTSTDAPEAKRRVKATNDVLYRIVVPSRQIGKVIGKVGHRIQKIREDTKATIKIADAISRHEERVIIISSKDSDSVFSDAENALHQIVSLILKDDDGNVEATKVGPGHVAANTIRILIAGSQAGGLIGVSGQNIENLRNSSGATITVLNPNQLPPCASAHESDRVVQISGEVPAVLRAVVEIGCQLRVNPPKQVISVSPAAPAYNTGFHRQPQLMDPNSAEYVTLDLMVPENLVGGLIGRFGANISRIRNESGANIKVYGARGEQTQRQIRLGGSSQQVALAKQRVDEYVYAELMRQAGGQLQQIATPHPVPDVSSTLYQGYGYAPGYYTNSNQETGLMAASVPPIYPPPPESTETNQAPYYGHQPYPAPQL